MADYAISNVPRRVVYAASGTGPYAFTFEILNQTDIAVYKASTLLTLTTDYTVTINANGTGSVTLVTTAGTSNITIVGSKNIQRTTDFTTGGDLFANTLNDELDNQTIFIQQVAETAERGLKAPVTDPTDIAMTLPAKDGRKGKVLAFDSTTGNPVAGPALDAVVTVIEQSANINTVAANIGSVNTVAGNTSNINTVAGVSSNVTTVATNIANVNAVGSDLLEAVSEVNTVAVNITNVNNVGTNISNVNSVAGNETNINAVVSNATNINAVAGNSTNINTVAGIAANINTVAGISANVTSVAGNAANINQVAADTVAINAASANAASAASSATAAGNSATSASASAAAASAASLANEPVRHSVRPSLLLDFANTKLLDPRITFTRASTATFYDGKTVAKAEENLLTFSEQFDNAIWTKARVTTTANAITAPDGTTTAEKIVEDTTASNFHLLYQDKAIAGLSYVASVYAKAGERSQISLNCGGVNDSVFDLSAGTATGTGVSIIAVGSGWYRCSVVVSSASNTQFRVFIFVSGVGSYTGDGTSGLFLWGAQLEQRSNITAYTATTTAPITNYIPALQTAAAGVARFEHNPVTGESLGLEIEEQRTNLVTYSEQIDNAAWTKVASTVSANAVVAPDGVLSSDLLLADTTTTQAKSVRNGSGLLTSQNTAVTCSIYVKPNGISFGYIGLTQGTAQTTFAVLRFDLNALTTNTSSSAWTTAGGTEGSGTITAVGNGWYRITYSLTTANSATGFAFRFGLLESVTQGLNALWTTAPSGFTGMAIWGAQLEAGSFATSYIPTVASQVTRSADAASMTGTNFSSWFNQDEGTLYNETTPAHIGTQYVVTIGDGISSTVGTGFFTDNSRLEARVRGTGASSTIGGGVVITANATFKAALYYSATNNAWAYNGSISSAINTNIRPAGSVSLRIGASPIGTITLTGTIKKLAYYPKRLTNAELQGLTTV